MVAKPKVDLNESSNSLKTTLEAMGSWDEKLCQVTKKANEAKNEATAWKVKT